jgi:hypothetical protein
MGHLLLGRLAVGHFNWKPLVYNILKWNLLFVFLSIGKWDREKGEKNLGRLSSKHSADWSGGRSKRAQHSPGSAKTGTKIDYLVQHALCTV